MLPTHTDRNAETAQSFAEKAGSTDIRHLSTYVNGSKVFEKSVMWLVREAEGQNGYKPIKHRVQTNI